MATLKLFAEVALLNDLPEHGLVRGQMGTVVHVHSPDAVEVEFSDNRGRTHAMLALRNEELLELHRYPLEAVQPIEP